MCVSQSRSAAPIPPLERVVTLALLVLLLATLFLRATTVLWSGALLSSIAALVAMPMCLPIALDLLQAQGRLHREVLSTLTRALRRLQPLLSEKELLERGFRVLRTLWMPTAMALGLAALALVRHLGSTGLPALDNLLNPWGVPGMVITLVTVVLATYPD